MISEKSQIIFMDEWTSDSLCCEDAKRILQGSSQGQISLSFFESATKGAVLLTNFQTYVTVSQWNTFFPWFRIQKT